MVDIKPLPSLSAQGMITEIVKKTDRAIAHFFASDANQDQLFVGNIANFSMLLQQAGNDIPRLKDQLRSTLETYLGRYYDLVIVSVDDDTDVNPSNRITLKFSAIVTQGGERYDVAHLLSLINGKFEKITKLNNTGSAN
jgi:hypothetical protein